MRPNNDPTKWVDEWPLSDLSAIQRTKIKAILLKAQAAFHRADFRDPYKFIEPMQQAFDGIAAVLFDAKILSVEFMENQLRLLVVESAIAGGWIYFATDEPRTEIFPGYLGNASVWERINDLKLIFSAEIAEWHSKLLDRGVEGISSDARKGAASSLNEAPLAEAGPGVLGAQLSLVKEHLRDLGTDSTFPRQERELLYGFYTHAREKLQLQLAVLDQKETVLSNEKAVTEARKALDFAQSEAGRQEARRERQTRLAGNALGTRTKTSDELSQVPENPEEDAIREAESQCAQSEVSLSKAHSELRAISSALERLRLDDHKWEEQKTAVRRWELSRKWEAITPDELRPAVEAIRHAFEHIGCWQSAQSTRKLCYPALHPVPTNDASSGDSANLDAYKRFLAALVGPQVQQSLLGANHPAPVIFRSYFDVLETAFKVVVRTEFQELFEIARVRTEILNMHPVEWTKRHLQILISDEKTRIRTWIQEVCDQRDLSRSTFSHEDMFWGDWRAPRLIHMQPAGNTPYDPATAWTREELARSVELLEKRAERFTDFLRIELDKRARAAHVQFAKQDDAIPRVSCQNESYRGTAPSSSAPPVADMQVSAVWQGLHDRFRALAEEELAIAPRNAGDRWLRAYVDYKDQGIPFGRWHLSEGVNESFHERFDLEATRAGIALNPGLPREARNVWLHHVFLDSLAHNSKLLFVASKDEGGIIVRACEASAICCARLERHSLVEGSDSSTSSVVPVQIVKPPSTNNGVASQAAWKNISILFLSDARVQIRNGPNSETLNYAEFGFKDGRTGNPNQAWETLRALAEKNGVIKDGSAVSKAWPKVEKRIQEIRKVLREHFGISTDPIEFVSGVGYKACFRIGCGPSFHT